MVGGGGRGWPWCVVVDLDAGWPPQPVSGHSGVYFVSRSAARPPDGLPSHLPSCLPSRLPPHLPACLPDRLPPHLLFTTLHASLPPTIPPSPPSLPLPPAQVLQLLELAKALESRISSLQYNGATVPPLQPPSSTQPAPPPFPSAAWRAQQLQPQQPLPPPPVSQRQQLEALEADSPEPKPWLHKKARMSEGELSLGDIEVCEGQGFVTWGVEVRRSGGLGCCKLGVRALQSGV